MIASPLIIMVDDDLDDQELFQSVLSEIHPGARCLFANDGDEGLSILESLETAADFIFIDINMPRMNGIEFLRHLKRLSTIPHTIVMYSTTSEPRVKALALELGAHYFITKPSSFLLLRDLLEEVLLQ